MAHRDFLAAVRDHVVVFDGSMAGSIGPTGHLPASDDPTLGAIRFRELVAVFTEQARGLLEGGVDLLIIETAQDILEVKASIFGVREAFKQAGRSVTLEALKVDAVGLNCSTGPEDMRDAVRYLGEYATVPVHCIPNAGLPLQGPDGE